MELKKTADIAMRDRSRIEEVDRYSDAQLQTLLRGAIPLSDVAATIQRLRSKELFLLAAYAARYPVSHWPPLQQRSDGAAAGTTKPQPTSPPDNGGLTDQDIIDLMRRADIAFKSPPPPIVVVDEEDEWEDEEEEEDYFKPARKKARAAPLMDLHKPACFKPSDDLRGNWHGDPRKLEKEFYEQLKGQEAGINSMTVVEYLENRARYDKIKRAGTGKAQEKSAKDMRNNIYNSVLYTLRKHGEVGQKAKHQALEKTKSIMSTLAALHEPDMSIGGQDPGLDPAAKPLRMGNRNVNSSIGAQWARKGRLAQMDAAAEQSLKQYGVDARMNVILERCKP